MNASDNPFAILKASTRDRKVRLNELADEAALYGDHDAAVNARNILSNPRTRLAAEVAWFPGRSEEHTSELQSLMRTSYAVCCLKKTNLNKTHETYTNETDT